MVESIIEALHLGLKIAICVVSLGVGVAGTVVAVDLVDRSTNGLPPTRSPDRTTGGLPPEVADLLNT